VDWNTPKWSNAEFDKLLDEASSIIDPVERRKVVAKLEQILQQDGPMVQPIWLDVQTAYDKRVLNFTLHPALCIFPEELALSA